MEKKMIGQNFNRPSFFVTFTASKLKRVCIPIRPDFVKEIVKTFGIIRLKVQMLRIFTRRRYNPTTYTIH